MGASDECVGPGTGQGRAHQAGRGRGLPLLLSGGRTRERTGRSEPVPSRHLGRRQGAPPLCRGMPRARRTDRDGDGLARPVGHPGHEHSGSTRGVVDVHPAGRHPVLRGRTVAGTEREVLPATVAGGGEARTRGEFKPCLFNMPKVFDAIHHGEEVWVVEGEKCVAAATTLGLVATTAPMGINGWKDYYAGWFTEGQGAKCVNVIVDNDEAGHRYGAAVAVCLRGVGVKVQDLAGRDHRGEGRPVRPRPRGLRGEGPGADQAQPAPSGGADAPAVDDQRSTRRSSGRSTGYCQPGWRCSVAHRSRASR